jgi:alpha-galactosidase
MEGILGNGDFEESAVNIVNDGLIDDLPSWLAVEIPARIGAGGVRGIPVANIPKGYLALLRNYAGVYDLTAEAVIHKKKSYAVQAILANPVVHQARNVGAMVDRMIDQQEQWLGYLR